jgi:hypothetical protein
MKPVYLIVGKTEIHIPRKVRDNFTVVRVEDGSDGVGWARAFQQPSIVHLCAPPKATLEAWIYPKQGSDTRIGRPQVIVSASMVTDQLKAIGSGYGRNLHHTSTPLSFHLKQYF